VQFSAAAGIWQMVEAVKLHGGSFLQDLNCDANKELAE
jgi:hypothetical protein